MQYVNRGKEPPPKTLLGSVPKMLRESLCSFMGQRDDRRAQSKPPTGSLNFKQGGLQQSLERLFNGRCAFCESAGLTEYYQFRPVGEAQPYTKSEFAHLYYCWLELAWQNFYSVCISCRPTEQGYFPVKGRRAEIPGQELFQKFLDQDNGLWPPDFYPPLESQLLLDPCEDRAFHKHLWIGTDGALHGISRRGTATINHFSLDRADLVKARQGAIQTRLGAIRHALQFEDADHIPEELFSFDSMEFGGIWYLLLRRMVIIMATESGESPSVSRKDIQRSLIRLCNRYDSLHLFDKCERKLERIRNPPAALTRQPSKRPSQARLVGVEIKNFRSIEHLELEIRDTNSPNESGKQTPALVILGENATGKSSVLEAIAIALAGPEARAKLAIPDDQLILSPDHFGEFKQQPPDSARISLRLLEDSQVRTRTIEIGRSSNDPPVTNSEEYIPVFAYGAFRKYGANSPPSSASKHVRNLFDSTDLANPEKWMLGLSNENFAMVTRALRRMFSIEADFDVIVRDKNKRKCLIVSAVDEDGQALSVTPLQTASSGFRSVLAMACDIMEGMMNLRFNPNFESLHTSRGVVLIDEVEAHLHPRWKIAIVGALRDALPSVTFIVTTHDPLCLRGMRDDEVAVLRRTRLNHGRTPGGMRSRVEVMSDVPMVSYYRIEQILTSDIFQLNSTDDPLVDSRMSDISDLLASSNLSDAQRRTIDDFKRDVAAAMPIGTTEAQRLVQEAVADYLQRRAHEQTEELPKLRESVKRRIIDALRGDI